MNVLGLCSYPVESAATRYRLIQFIEPLKKRGINLTVLPFLNSEKFQQFYKGNKISKVLNLTFPFAKRFFELIKFRNFDLVFIQREAMFFGPAFFELLFQKIGNCPLVLDLDDATYIKYISPTYGQIGSFFKFFGKTNILIDRADVVICGNRFIAEYVEGRGREAVIVPTIVDTNNFSPVTKSNEIPVIGWIGTHSTYPSLVSLFPVLKTLAKKYDFKLKIVGSGVEEINIDGIKIENLEWNLNREIKDFQTLNIGLYPIETSSSANEEWIKGKSGFKAIQYMAVGIPFVVTPIGVCAEIGIPNVTHFEATSSNEWYNALDKLLSDTLLQYEMGASGRRFSLTHYSVTKQAEILAETLYSICKNRK